MARLKRQGRSNIMDEWLESQGYYRKHTAMDASCLFRAVAEQIFHSQVLHLDVRMACVKFMERNRKMFDELIAGSYEEHLINLQNPKECAGQVEMHAMSWLFKCDFEVFREVGKHPYQATDNGFRKKVMLCFSHGNHYDSVYPKTFVADAAFCQSSVYNILYKQVYKLGDEVDIAVEKMLHDKVYAKHRKDSSASYDSTCPSPELIAELELTEVSNEWKDKDGGSEIRRALALGIPPFPYKVAKALDPEIYRNVEYDIWNEARKDEPVFEPGVKCLVRINSHNNVRLNDSKTEAYHAHIQEVCNENGPVTVYIEELGKKETVAFDSLAPLPSSPTKGTWQQQTGKSYRAISGYYQKTSVNGTMTEIDKFRGRRKFPKKDKYKETAAFPLPIPRSQGLTPRHQPMSYDHTIISPPVGRGRGFSYQTIRRSPSPRLKWSQPISHGNRYHVRSGNGFGKYTGNQQSGNNGSILKSQNTEVPSASWAKAATTVPSTMHQSLVTSHICDTGGHVRVSGGHDFKQDVQYEMCQSASHEAFSCTPTPPTCASPCLVTTTTSSPQNVEGNNELQSVNAPTHSTPLPADPSGLIPSHYMSSANLPPPVGIHPSFLPQSHGYSPYPVYPGMLVPTPDVPGQLINYNVLRSQDPNGTDLPLQDLSTLRFFFNLGHDYFRMASTMIPIQQQAQPQYAVWNYNNQVAVAAVNGFLTPVSSSDQSDDTVQGSDSRRQTPDIPTRIETEHSHPHYAQPEDLRGGFLYTVATGSPFFPPADLGLYAPQVATPPLATDFRNSLMLDDQGVLTLTAVDAGIHPTIGAYRRRSDSGDSTRSWHSLQEGTTYKDRDYSVAQGRGVHFRSGGSNPHLPPRFNRRNASSGHSGGPRGRGAPTCSAIYGAATPTVNVQVPSEVLSPPMSFSQYGVMHTPPSASQLPGQPIAYPTATLVMSPPNSVGYYHSSGIPTAGGTVSSPSQSAALMTTAYYSPQQYVYPQQQLSYLPAVVQ